LKEKEKGKKIVVVDVLLVAARWASSNTTFLIHVLSMALALRRIYGALSVRTWD
jgi:hypothetical protein